MLASYRFGEMLALRRKPVVVAVTHVPRAACACAQRLGATRGGADAKELQKWNEAMETKTPSPPPAGPRRRRRLADAAAATRTWVECQAANGAGSPLEPVGKFKLLGITAY